MDPQLNTYENLHVLADLLIKTWGKRSAIKRASLLCGDDEHLRELNIMWEYMQKF
jgi:hypothetical protein